MTATHYRQCACADCIAARPTLAEWSAKHGIAARVPSNFPMLRIVNENDVPTDAWRELWRLRDYCVSSVSCMQAWLRPTPAPTDADVASDPRA